MKEINEEEVKGKATFLQETKDIEAHEVKLAALKAQKDELFVRKESCLSGTG